MKYIRKVKEEQDERIQSTNGSRSRGNTRIHREETDELMRTFVNNERPYSIKTIWETRT